MFHPVAGRATQLPRKHMEYRLIPFVTADIIHPNFDRKAVVLSQRYCVNASRSINRDIRSSHMEDLLNAKPCAV